MCLRLPLRIRSNTLDCVYYVHIYVHTHSAKFAFPFIIIFAWFFLWYARWKYFTTSCNSNETLLWYLHANGWLINAFTGAHAIRERSFVHSVAVIVITLTSLRVQMGQSTTSNIVVSIEHSFVPFCLVPVFDFHTERHSTELFSHSLTLLLTHIPCLHSDRKQIYVSCHRNKPSSLLLSFCHKLCAFYKSFNFLFWA